MDKVQINELASKFEEKYGTDALLKTGLSSLNRLLIEKGLATEDEIYTSFVKEVQRRIAELK